MQVVSLKMPAYVRQILAPGMLILPIFVLTLSCRSKARINADLMKAGNESLSCIPDWRRDFNDKPSVIIRENITSPVYFLGDIHGEIRKTHPLLVKAGLTEGTVEQPRWVGKKSILVVLGDVIDKGPHTIETINYLMALESQAPSSGGEVHVIAGNHEIGFLLNPRNEKAIDFLKEIDDTKFDLCSDIYSSQTKIGRWLRDRPAAVKINGTFASHTGFPKWSLDEINEKYQKLFHSSGQTTGFSCGDISGANKHPGFFTARTWWRDEQKFFEGLTRLGVYQIIFGHDPNAFDDRGQIQGYFADDKGRALIKTDVGLNIGDSDGEILQCSSWHSAGYCSNFDVIKLKSSKKATDRSSIQLFKDKPPEVDKEVVEKDC